MKSLTSISLQNEPWLEKWARLFRFAKVLPLLTSKLEANTKTISLVDFGCGQDILLHNYIKEQFPESEHRISYTGVDPLLKKDKRKSFGVCIVPKLFESTKMRKTADIITMLAVLEHVDDPLNLLEHAMRALRKNGVIIITTPTPLAKIILEFLAYTAHSISKREIDEHKRYPTKQSLYKLITQLKKRGYKLEAKHQYFELGLNNLLTIRNLQ